jgi:hypothetical protein
VLARDLASKPEASTLLYFETMSPVIRESTLGWTKTISRRSTVSEKSLTATGCPAQHWHPMNNCNQNKPQLTRTANQQNQDRVLICMRVYCWCRVQFIVHLMVFTMITIYVYVHSISVLRLRCSKPNKSYACLVSTLVLSLSGEITFICNRD